MAVPHVFTMPETVAGTNYESFRAATLDTAPVSLGSRRTNSPHEFYRYPARFSPQFAAAAIEAFSHPGQTILDPFVGGGTTLVEAMRLRRTAIGADLNPLATFIARVKTTPLTPREASSIARWLASLDAALKLTQPEPDPGTWAAAGYLKDLHAPDTWRIRKLIGLALRALPPSQGVARDFCRCVILRTAQWALDMRRMIPSGTDFRNALTVNGMEMLDVMRRFSAEVDGAPAPLIIECGLPALGEKLAASGFGPPLVVTSPPYPGVYVNYHRWKLRGRREIAAPYWIADRRDGNGLAHYTMSARSEPSRQVYFARIREAFRGLARGLADGTLVIQIVGFNDPEVQLPNYLSAMADAGFAEQIVPGLSQTGDRRLWRTVPGRRWWAQASTLRTTTPNTGREVVFFHRLGS